jgi:hypothetical protein
MISKTNQAFASLLFIHVFSLRNYFFFLLVFLFSACKKNDYQAQVELPKVVSVTPGNNTMNVALDSVITISFNESMDSTSINKSTIQLRDNNDFIGGIIEYKNKQVLFTPVIDLQPNTDYTLIVSAAVRNAAQHNMPADYIEHFTTRGPEHYTMTTTSDAVTDFVRDGTRSAQIGSYVYSFGGWNVPEESWNDVYRSRGALTTWEKRPNAPWHGRHVYGLAQLNGATYVIGGDNLHHDFDVWSTRDGETWTQLADNILDNRIYYGCTAHNGYLYVVGGIHYSDVWRSRDGANWTRIADNIAFLNGENFAGSLASFNGKLWMICGGAADGIGTPRKTVWSSADDGITWTQERDFGGSPRYYTDVCVWDNKLWVVGGYNYDEGNVRSIWYMKRDGRWNEFVPPADYLGRHATGVAVYNNKLVITCGNYNNDCWVIEKNN